MKRFFFIAAAVLGFAACEPAQEEVIWPELEMSFAQKNYTMVLDSEQEIEYTVTGIQGAEVEVIATLANTEDWSVESQFNSETGKGVLTVTAPAKASVTTLTVEVKDAKNNRTVSTTFALASTPEGLPAITVAFTGESHAITAGEGTLALEFEVTGLGNATLVDPVEADVTTNLNVVSVTWNSETAKGVVTLSAPINAVTGQENVSIKVKDTYAREAIDVAEGNEKYTSLDGVVLVANEEKAEDGSLVFETIALYPVGKKGEYAVPESVKNIANRAFYNCDALTGIVFADGFKNIGEEAFFDCDGITTITMPESAGDIGSYAFASCDELREFIVYSNLTDYADNAFDGCYYINYDAVTIKVEDSSASLLIVVAAVLGVIGAIGYVVYQKKQKKAEKEILEKIAKREALEVAKEEAKAE